MKQSYNVSKIENINGSYMNCRLSEQQRKGMFQIQHQIKLNAASLGNACSRI